MIRYFIISIVILFLSVPFFAKANFISAEVCEQYLLQGEYDSLRNYLLQFEYSVDDSLFSLKEYYLGRSQRNQGDCESSLKHLHNALKCPFDEYSALKANIFEEIALCLRRSSNKSIEKPLSYINRAIRINESILDSNRLARSYFIKGNIFLSNNAQIVEYDSANYYYNHALDICPKKNKLIYGQIINNQIYLIDFDTEPHAALEKLKEAKEIFIEQGKSKSLLYNQVSTAEIYIKLKELAPAKKILDECFLMIDQEGLNSESEYVVDLMSTYYKASGNYIKALEWKDTLHTIVHTKYYELEAEAEEKYKNSELKTKLEREENLNLQNQIRLKNRQLWLTILGALLTLLSLITFGIYRYQSLRKKAIQKELENTKIKAAYDATRAKMEGEQKERQVIASVLHDQVASLLTAADMHLAVAKKKASGSSEYIDKTNLILKDVNIQVRNLSHQLVSPALMKFGLEPALDSLVEQMETDQMQITYTSNVGRDRLDDTKEIFLYRSCAELLQNTLKHSNGNKATVQLHNQNENVSLTVKDNGANDSGISESGLGLTHIQNRAEALGGSFEFSKNNTGAYSKIIIPI